MSFENKLINLVFKNKENSAKTQFPSFSFSFFFYFFLIFFIIEIKITWNEIHECYAMQIVEIKGKTQKPKNKEQWSQREIQ